MLKLKSNLNLLNQLSLGFKTSSRNHIRTISTSNWIQANKFDRPSPPRLPPKEQKEFEKLLKEKASESSTVEYNKQHIQHFLNIHRCLSLRILISNSLLTRSWFFLLPSLSQISPLSLKTQRTIQKQVNCIPTQGGNPLPTSRERPTLRRARLEVQRRIPSLGRGNGLMVGEPQISRWGWQATVGFEVRMRGRR